jgi:thioesterase domain-containing protein
VTGIEGLGVNDDYFAIGGSSLLAAQLFSEITRQFRVKLPLTTVLGYPTVRTLSRRIEQFSQPASSLVELKPGSAGNLFLIHDGDGETLLYANLARRLPSDIAVFGIEPKTLPDIPLAHASIEDMAAWYIGVLKEIQPEGPYLLGGMCAGGVIAYEMATQLERARGEVELLVLLDAAAPRAAKRSGRITKQRLGRLAGVLNGADGARIQRLIGSIFVILGKLWSAARWEMLSVYRRWSSRLRFDLLQFLLRRGWSWPRFIPDLTVREIYENAENDYQPKYLSGTKRTLLVRATLGEMTDTPYREVYSDNSLGWSAFVSNLTIADVEGGHSSMLQEPFVKSLAGTLRPLLNCQATSNRAAALPVTESA